MATPSTDRSLTEGDLKGPLFALSWPIIVTELLQVTYNLSDTLWLGRYSTDALAAISLAFPLVFLFISIGGGFTVAGTILVAQYTGADSDGSASIVVGQTLGFIGAIAVVVGLLGFFLTDPLLGVLPSSPATAGAVVPLAGDYMRVFFLGLPFVFGFYVFAALMRGYGNTRTPMRVMFVSVVLNVAIDPFLIFGWWLFPELGVTGAAIATVFSRGVATVIGVYVLLYTDAGPDVSLDDFAPRIEYVRDIVRLGVPAGIEQSMTAVGLISLTAMVVTFAPEVVAAYGLGNRLTSLVFLPALGLGRAINTMVGQSLGAQRPDRAEVAVGIALKVGVGVMLAVAAISFVFAEPIVGAFVGQNVGAPEAVISLGAEYVRIRTVEFGFIAVLQIVLGAYRGAGNTRTAMAFSLLALWGGRVPIVYYLVFVAGYGPTGIWIGMAAGQIIGAICAAAWFTRGTWKDTYIDESAAA